MASRCRRPVRPRRPGSPTPAREPGLAMRRSSPSLGVPGEDARSLGGHGAVEVHGDVRKPARAAKAVQVQQERLRPPDGERRDQHHAPACRGALDDLGQLVRGVGVLVQPVAIGGFDNYVVGRASGLGRGQQGVGGPAQVTREAQRAVVGPQPHGRGAGDVPRWGEAEAESAGRLLLLLPSEDHPRTIRSWRMARSASAAVYSGNAGWWREYPPRLA